MTDRRGRASRFAVEVGIGVAGVLLVTWAVENISVGGQSVSLAVLLVPVMCVALVGGTVETTTVAAFAVVIGTYGYLSSNDPGSAVAQVRYGALVVGCVLATLLTVVRQRRDRTIARKQAQLLATESRLQSEELINEILQRSPEMAVATTIPEAARRACELACDLFDCSAASYWQVDGDECVLWARSPADGPWPLGYRVPCQLFITESRTMVSSRSAWQSRQALADPDDPRRKAMERTGAEVGTSTPVVVGGETVAYLALNWTVARPRPEGSWADALDRFVDQLALAKSVIRRRNAQAEASRMVQRLQAGLLPAVLPAEGSTTVRTLYRPGQRQMLLGGDFLDVTRDGDTISFILGDVSGHGPEQAALGTLLRAAWLGLTAVPGNSLKEWGPVLERILQENRVDDLMYATAVMGQVVPAERAIRYVAAGHPAPIFCTPRVQMAPLGGPPLGLGLGGDLEVQLVELPEPSWSVLLVTDGLYEGMVNPQSDQRLGLNGFVDVLRQHTDIRSVTDSGFLDSLADDMQSRNGGPLPDDAAAILILPRVPNHDPKWNAMDPSLLHQVPPVLR